MVRNADPETKMVQVPRAKSADRDAPRRNHEACLGAPDRANPARGSHTNRRDTPNFRGNLAGGRAQYGAPAHEEQSAAQPGSPAESRRRHPRESERAAWKNPLLPRQSKPTKN